MLGRDRGKGGRFARLHVDAAEMDCPAKRPLDGRLEEVKFAHRDAAAGYDYVNAGEGGTERFFESARSMITLACRCLIVFNKRK